MYSKKMKQNFPVLTYINIQRLNSEYWRRIFAIESHRTAVRSAQSHPSWRTFIVLLLIVWFSNLSLAQTSLRGSSSVAIITPNEIAIASDSRAMDSDDTINPQLFCKVRQIGSVIFVGANLVSVLETNYNAYSIFTQVTQGEMAFADRVSALEREIKPALTKALILYKRLKPEKYARDYDGKKAFSFILATVEQGVPKLAMRSFISVAGSEPVTVQIEARDCPNKACPAVAAAYIGRTEAIEKFFTTPHPYFKDLPSVEMARLLVTLEIVENKDVGMPIDIVRLDATGGAHWIQRKPECEEPKKAEPNKIKGRGSPRRRS